MPINDTWLPKCLAHLDEPYLKDTDEFVVIGELSSEERNGYSGIRQLHTILVPIDRIGEVLTAPGGIGWEVKSWGPSPVVDEGEVYTSDFWVQGPEGWNDRLEPLVVSWEQHNKTVMMPDNGLLMCYGLCPRTQSGPDKIIWDNLSRPEYDVVSVKPLSHYTVPSSYSGTEVRIARKYLEDYASLKSCAVVSVFYEERRCQLDDELKARFKSKDGVSLKFPGRKLDIIRNKDNRKAPILCRIWGCCLVLTPSKRPVSEEQEPELEWPGCPGVMTCTRALSRPIDYVYVSDQVLEQFEGKAKYEINPVYGSVSYDGWWSLSFCHRVGRDYIAYDLKKLYEGCNSTVIEHVHRFAIDERVAEEQARVLGDQNIGKRASGLIERFLEMGSELVAFGDLFGFPFVEKDIISFDSKLVNYGGWWTNDLLVSLGYRAPQDMNRPQFLGRCETIFKLFEFVKEKPLRRMLKKIGLPPSEIKSLGSLKLLATLMQICRISLETGLSIEHQEIANRWNKDIRLDYLQPLFALYDLRQASAHQLGKNESNKMKAALDVYEIDEKNMISGWGLAVDQVYDRLSESLGEITFMLNKCRLESR